MPITHHPPDDTVLRYANGTLPEAPAIVVATHLSFCPDCRVRMQTYEMLGGSVLEEFAPSALSADALSVTLAKLDADAVSNAGDAVSNAGKTDASASAGKGDVTANAGAAVRTNGVGVSAQALDRAGVRLDSIESRHRPDLPSGMDWPQPLRHYDIPNWRFAFPGVKWSTLPLTGPESGQLLLVRGIPGAKLPSHGHDGTEYTCVLTGSFSDSSGTYRIGDLIEASEDHDHQPIVSPDAECICLIAIEGHLRLHGLAKLLQPFLGL